MRKIVREILFIKAHFILLFIILYYVDSLDFQNFLYDFTARSLIRVKSAVTLNVKQVLFAVDKATLRPFFSLFLFTDFFPIYRKRAYKNDGIFMIFMWWKHNFPFITHSLVDFGWPSTLLCISDSDSSTSQFHCII